MAKKTVVQEQSLESILWNCRNALRGTVGGNEKNRDAVMGLVFLKFAGDKFEKRREEIKAQYGDVPAFLEKASFYLSENVFYLSETSRWSYIVMNASSDEIAVILDKAMADIEDKNKSLKGALPQNFYATLGARSASIKGLIDEINKIDEKKFQDKDLIGRVYEYFLQVFAMDAGQGAEKGEFYTPASIVNLIAELIEPYSGRVYDPCCGSGGMFVQSVKFVERHNGNRLKISVIGQESNPDTWRLAKMNLAIRGISYHLGDRAISTFIDDRHKDDKVDFIMANPPFNLKNWRGKDELTDDYRWRGYDVPPVSNANYAWVLHMLAKLDVTNGIAGFLLSNGALNAGGEEYKIRKQLIENDKLEAIIVLPREMFYSTDISVTLWIVNNNKKARMLNGRELRDRQNEVLFIDLRRWNENVYEKKYVMFDEEQIANIKKIYTDWQNADKSAYTDMPELCKSAKLEEIRVRNYSLAPSKYIEFIDHDLEIDYAAEMARIQGEMREILKAEKASQTMLETAFKGIGYGIE
ncbi:type I restriction-modification system subunit M [Paenibacillus spongiae]|uniref:site-specific DNA-methyltransferase (adenine-specific) n=1 Tax=Paenibacillus spongiae TaxID=2909671 RepID=A0ABY5SAR5_9BACL|nr:class I SAM-dependent DNA methyltransferase [Paenibacillus spongiae]UVI31007.1 type I restriction-modification system subunit M [Paenibacillus spongiae]